MTASVATSDAFVRARVGADIKQRAGAALGAMGLSISDAIRLLLVRVANEGRLPFELAAPWAAPQKATQTTAAKTFRDKGVHELTVEDCEEMLRAAHRGEPPPPRPSWESLAQYLPADPDFLKERPELFDFERVDKLFEGWDG